MESEHWPLVDQSGSYEKASRRERETVEEVEVVEVPSRMIAWLYCFLPGGHPVCVPAHPVSPSPASPAKYTYISVS